MTFKEAWDFYINSFDVPYNCFESSSEDVKVASDNGVRFYN